MSIRSVKMIRILRHWFCNISFYHGWQFQGNGLCVKVPYLASNQKLPHCQLRPYPVRDVNGFIWLFPGESHLAPQIQPLAIPEWEHLNYIATVFLNFDRVIFYVNRMRQAIGSSG